MSFKNVIGKTMERIVKEGVMNHVETHGTLTEAQHGFRSGRSPQTNLKEFLNVKTKWMDEGKSFDMKVGQHYYSTLLY